MIAATGWTAIVIALAGSVSLVIHGWRAERRPQGVPRAALKLSVGGMVFGSVVAFGALQVALLTDDFSVSYVAENSARATPLLFKISTAWSALSGSIVLWTLVLAGFTAAVLRQVRDMQDRLGIGALVVMGLVATFFFGLVATVANPFEILANPPTDGPGPNPILQNHFMVLIHPPMLYLGLVGFTVPFAFAMSALMLRQGGVDWLRRTRRSNLVAWTFLTGGLVYGAWWSYEVLGWGGFWAWDPVENAALIPWLLATAFIHSSALQVRRGMLQAWNFVLVLATFSTTILATLLTRSSVIASVHSFTQSGVGPALLGFLVIVLGVGFTLFAMRGEQLLSNRRPESILSREGAFLTNNVILSVFAFVVLLGTIYPVFVEAFSGGQVSVGRPFFDRMAVPLSFALLLAMGIGPFMPYRRAGGAVMWQRLRVPLLLAAAVSAALVLAGLREVSVVLVAFLVTAMVSGTVRELLTNAPQPRPQSIWRLVRRQHGYWGGQLAHIGLALVALAIATSGTLAERASVSLTIGESTPFDGYTLTYEGIEQVPGGDRSATIAGIVFEADGEVVFRAEPALTQFNNQVQAVATPSIWSTPTRDIYVALSSLEDGQVTINLYRYPFMWLLWTGGLTVMVGGVWALAGGARRRGAAVQLEEHRTSEKGAHD
ncbi:heme lyase CcmF/NrfE family subunit [Demequina sp. TTPB684]|uniref:heme lyase CcmF/NrfE family subunit n=1 Tax=unclassified Demequina TaxID=2620311 RepID=UPI001CF31A59|nr:heme lyase CcmF/NrfE family subunit [Demequina sp. TMPB413]MCB2412544.1 heme lyase CcmF/NrfE family subunit [Demequina sp. TTPB684]UPU87802.1 heme lyase CcmF/NrfE family subunit [Demequina sp. TMPB413]